MEFAHTLDYAAKACRKYSSLSGGAKLSDAEKRNVVTLFEKNNDEFVKTLADVIRNVEDQRVLQTLAHSLGEYSHAYLDVLKIAAPQSQQLAAAVQTKVAEARAECAREIEELKANQTEKIQKATRKGDLRGDLLASAFFSNLF